MVDLGFEVRDLVKRFGRNTAVDGANLEAPQGEVFGLLGPNGAGKTTIIRVLATLLRPDAGTVRVRGIDVEREPAKVRQRIALSGQHTTVDDELTGRANLVLIGRLLNLTASDARTRAAELLARFGLDESADRSVVGYSGGMRRRLDLAAGLVGRPEVLFLDEPSVGLDPGKRDDLWHIIRGLAEDGITVLLTTQYLEEADALANQISVIDHGRVIATGTPTDLKRRVGGHAVVVRPAATDIEHAARTLTAVTGRQPDRSHRDELITPVTDQNTFFEITAALHHHGVGINEIALRLPSLDEAFLALTGTRTRDAKDGA